MYSMTNHFYRSSYSLLITLILYVCLCLVESTTYPKQVPDLQGFKVHSITGGNNVVIVVADDNVVAWGVPVAGKLGLEGGGKSSIPPKFVSDLNKLQPIQVSCGYGHVCVLVSNAASYSAVLKAFPELPATEAELQHGGGKITSSSSSSTTSKKRATETVATKKTPAPKKAKK